YKQCNTLLLRHPTFQNFCRFARMRMRLLLLKQDEISLLEESLDKIHADETRDFHLGSNRHDSNAERKEVLKKLKVSIEAYDSMIDQSCRMLSFPQVTNRDISSLKNWLECVGSISMYETTYLDNYADRLNITATLEDCLSWIDLTLPKVYHPRRHKFSGQSPQELLILGPKARMLCRVLPTWLATTLLLIPVIILYVVSNPKVRLAIIALAAEFFLSNVSVFAKARTIEVILTGAR
ncbi:uncharacterized protein BDR25DRAFT_216047, partial [Lindgomyces ingoldianus]